MRLAYASLVILLSAYSVLGADPPTLLPIRMPELVQPDPPRPMPAVDTPAKLTPDLLYVFDADVDVLVLSSPAGLVLVTVEDGPVKMRGKFVDGNGKTQTRTYKGKHVYTVEPTHSGRCELLVVPVGAKTDKEVVRRMIDVDDGTGPRPPTPPDPSKPDGALGLRKASRDATAKVVVAVRGVDAAKLARAQRSLASAIAAGGVGEPAAILAAWRDGNRAAVTAQDAWAPWATAVSTGLSKLYADGKLAAKADWVAAFTEIAEGLED